MRRRLSLRGWHTATISRKGTITIPAALRHKLGITPGQLVTIKVTTNGRWLSIRADATSPNPRPIDEPRQPGRSA